MINIKDKNWLLIIISILVLVFLIPGYQNLSLLIILVALFAVYGIVIGILNHKSAIVSVVMGFVMLIVGLLWIFIQKLSLTSLDVILYIIIAMGFLITALLTQLGYLPEKWL